MTPDEIRAWGSVIAFGLVGGSGTLLLVRWWALRVMDRLAIGEKANETRRDEIGRHAQRIVKLESIAESNKDALKEINGSLSALHRRLDERVLGDHEQHERLAERLGALAAEVARRNGTMK